MKIAFITDTHIGARGESPLFLKHFLDFFDQQFFPYCEENDIRRIVCLGDVFDRRKFVNMNVLAEFNKRFTKRFVDGDFELDTILGNHDQYYKSTNVVNTPSQVFARINNIRVISTPTILSIGGVEFGCVPWIDDNNADQCRDFIEARETDILLGHFAINGFFVQKGMAHQGGLGQEVFKNYKAVYSGHFHARQTNGNITYLGAPYQMTFADVHDLKGFHVFDTETSSMDFIPNNDRMFHVLSYDDKADNGIPEIDPKFQDKYIKVLILNKTKPYHFDKWLESLEKTFPARVQLVEDQQIELSKEEVSDTTQDTLSIIHGEVSAMPELSDTEKQEIGKIMLELYTESLSGLD